MESLFINKHSDVVAKKNSLDEIAAKLKARFVGLDYIIDDVMSVVSAWYIFPKAQLRPCIINLWGLTGSGKTALINGLVDLLDHRKFYVHFDMGEFQSESAKWIKRTFVEDLAHFDKEQVVICLDEFRFARTINDQEETNNDKLRVIWEIMDSGKVTYLPDISQFFLSRAEMLISLLKVFRSKGGEISNGEVVDEKEAFVQLFESFYFDESDRHGEAMSVNYFKSKDFLIGVMGLNDRIIPEDLMKKKILSCNVNELILLIAGLIKQAVVPKEVDLRHALIFVVGNLDEAYSMSRDLDPDMDADIMHELTKKITVAEIKEALLTRFRSEQVARLGNNHFIYRAFSSAQFREVIRRELARISAFANAELGWTINFSESIVDVIYSEGVISTQGTRPVYTTINNLVQSRIGKVAIGASRVEQNVASVDWSFNDNAFRFDFKDANQAVVASIGEKIELTMAKQRAPADPNVQAHVAVHESGHAILAALLLRIVPSVVVSRSASANSVGFCYVRFPKGMMTNDTLLKDISISLGGLAAEKIVFGEQFTSSGVGSDIAEASRLANNAIRRFGMGSDPIRLAAAMNAATQDYFGDTYSYEEESVRLVRDCMMVAEAILNRNKLLLLKMSEYLTRNSRMEMSVIEEFVTKYSTEDWVQESGFTQPEEYYEFDKVVESQLKELVEQQATSVLLTP